jgi:hypothetical protein
MFSSSAKAMGTRLGSSLIGLESPVSIVYSIKFVVLSLITANFVTPSALQYVYYMSELQYILDINCISVLTTFILN